MSPTFQATFWGFFSGGALVLGAAVGYFANVPGKVVAGVMASLNQLRSGLVYFTVVR